MGNKRHSVLDWISDFAPLAFLFLEGDEMKREKEREGAWDLCSSSHFPPLESGVLLMTRSGEEMHRSRSLLLGEQFLHAVVSQEGGIAMVHGRLSRRAKLMFFSQILEDREHRDGPAGCVLHRATPPVHSDSESVDLFLLALVRPTEKAEDAGFTLSVCISKSTTYR